jgi:Zn-dependent protease
VSSSPPGLRLLGFPITVAPGFVLGLLLIAGLSAANPPFALRLVVALAGFIVIHELGHALMARRYGADARISLNFLVGYAMFTPSRPLARSERAAISAAGPFVQIATGSALLVALGASPLAPSSFDGDPLRLAVWWAGPALGALNLLPVLPLDGGNIVALGLDRVIPGRGEQLLLYWTVAVCAVAVGAVVLSPAWRPWALTVGLFTFWTLQSLTAERRRSRPADQTAARRTFDAAQAAERETWATGRRGVFPPGYEASPWVKAHLLADSGRDESARSLLLQALERGGGTWVPPEAAPTDALLRLVELLPEDPPAGHLQAGFELQWALHRTGYLRRAASYGARLYAAHPLPTVAHNVAGALALLGDGDTAMDWLRTAHAANSDPSWLDHDADLESLRHRRDFQELRAEVVARSGR